MLKTHEGTYRGFFKDNKMHGKGEFIFANGDVFTGNFENNLKSGPGEYVERAGNRFSGNYFNNEKNGHSILHLADGSVE